MINSFRTPNGQLKRERAELYCVTMGKTYLGNNIMKYGYDLDMEVYGIWLEAIDLCAIRSFRIPKEILDDFYYEHKGKFEE